MAETAEQAKPLAPPAIFQFRSDEEEALTTKSRQRNCVKIFGCITAFLLILAVTILVLFFTVFHVRDPVIKISKITLLEPNIWSPTADSNVTLLLDVSVKNPNAASFKFNNGTTTVSHGGEVIGEGGTPAGVAKARRTIHMNVTVNMVPEKLVSLIKDATSGSLRVNSSTVIGGKVKILKIIKKYLAVQVNCSVAYNLTSHEIQQSCRPHFI